ncbi:hypothetical protein GQ600_162 [Phytophthora cactorum]|nr:hypothetical protein GQ600_162 [Phytophthora cactorum]
MLGDISLTEEELGMLFGPASNGVDGCSTLHAAANNRKSTRNAPGKRAAAKMKAKTSSTNKFCATLLSTVGGGIVPARCGYRTGKCQNLQAIKRNGKLHKLCEFHRERANLNQKKLDRKKRMQRSKLSRVPSSSCESVSSASSVISEDDNCSLDLENRSPRTVEAAVTTSVFIKRSLKNSIQSFSYPPASTRPTGARLRGTRHLLQSYDLRRQPSKRLQSAHLRAITPRA